MIVDFGFWYFKDIFKFNFYCFIVVRVKFENIFKILKIKISNYLLIVIFLVKWVVYRYFDKWC